MLKTFTVLVTVPASYTTSSVERAMADGLQAFGVDDDGMRVDAFEGDHMAPAAMHPAQAGTLIDARKAHADLRKVLGA